MNLFRTYAFIRLGQFVTYQELKRFNADLPLYYIRVVLEPHDSSELQKIIQCVGSSVWDNFTIFTTPPISGRYGPHAHTLWFTILEKMFFG